MFFHNWYGFTEKPVKLGSVVGRRCRRSRRHILYSSSVWVLLLMFIMHILKWYDLIELVVNETAR